ncbi:MAG: peptide ABC transporter substrate-binding protein [Ruminococcaceae bacterium]|nr:peptide ABC transporter substrate-binding protein [Oscillospiraceae bacterium]
MKKIVSIIIVCLTLVATLSGCAADKDDTGAIIPVFITEEISNYDPVPMMYDADVFKNTTLLYEGLTVLKENGKIEKGMASDWYTKIDEEKGEYWLFFELKETSWDDQKYVQADDFVYAWRRILSPETSSPAACLLYGIKNAKAYKAGDVTADDLGVYAESDSLLKIEFEGPFNLDLFLEAVSSPALVASREDNVAGNEDSWAASLDDFSANSAFTLKNFDPTKSVTFQRNAVYNREKSSDSAVYKVVKPYKLTIDFTFTTAEQMERFENGEIYYISAFEKETYAANEKKMETSDLLSVYSYFFNTTKAPFDNSLVRQALSLALDREKIAEISGLGVKPATGLVTYGVNDKKAGKEFRKVGGDLISVSANLKEAKTLIKKAGITPSDYTINIYTLRDTADVEIAKYTKEVWEGLGFKVTLSSGAGKAYTNKLYKGDFDVIGIDYQGLAPDAFAFLAPFAKEFSGEAIDITGEERTATHVTGFDNEKYNKLIEKISVTTDRKERTALLHDAEEMLLELSPVAPLHFNVNSYLKSKKLSKLDTSGYGYTIFKNAKLKNYKESNAVILAQEEAARQEKLEAQKKK